jgi:hypothetical protein
MRYAVVKVEPVGTHRAGGFRHHADGRVETSWDEPTYPDDGGLGKALRDARVFGGKVVPHTTLGAAARLLGIEVVEYSGLEHGRYTFADSADWDRAIAALEGRKNNDDAKDGGR